jgi:hypothetical protein
MTQSVTLPGTIQPASPGLTGFDADTAISADTAAAFADNGFAFCARYLSRGEGQAQGDLSKAEAIGILNAGLALIAVQHVPGLGWHPNGGLGTTYGNNAAGNAASIGLPAGMNIWCDLEGIAPETPAQNVIDYCQAWYNAVSNAGYIPGLYVGANCILNGTQLYDLSFQHYWQSLSNVPLIPNRGYQLVQHGTTEKFGISIDTDTTENDEEGGAVIWLQG